MRSEQEVKDLLRQVARSLQSAGPVESVAGNTNNDMSTTIAAALAPLTPFEKNRMAQQKEFFNKVVENFLSEKYQVHLYCAGEKTPILSKESLSSLKNPGYHIFVTNFEWLRAKQKGQNKPDLREVFDTVIVDEAHTIRDENTGKYEVLSNLAPRNLLLLTGTPVMNRDIDLAAMLSLFRPGSLWEDMGCDRKINPFRLEDDHPFAVLGATSFAVHRYLNTLSDKDYVNRGEWLGMIYDIVLLKRGLVIADWTVMDCQSVLHSNHLRASFIHQRDQVISKQVLTNKLLPLHTPEMWSHGNRASSVIEGPIVGIKKAQILGWSLLISISIMN
ncbi:hypothetical protein BOTCAL_0025g00090 [Botryotinia calthae]|uniref:Helicase ATP-binding domain-containing protein n=1 Tax=Botryotinia calthae TaxID=38488 RepID=A0A4Y8DE91_9HELO|nr:hypothetical protein BOTCAL_0025g00090 [Botryotinia calthae]